MFFFFSLIGCTVIPPPTHTHTSPAPGSPTLLLIPSRAIFNVLLFSYLSFIFHSLFAPWHRLTPWWYSYRVSARRQLFFIVFFTGCNVPPHPSRSVPPPLPRFQVFFAFFLLTFPCFHLLNCLLLYSQLPLSMIWSLSQVGDTGSS